MQQTSLSPSQKALGGLKGKTLQQHEMKAALRRSINQNKERSRRHVKDQELSIGFERDKLRNQESLKGGISGTKKEIQATNTQVNFKLQDIVGANGEPVDNTHEAYGQAITKLIDANQKPSKEHQDELYPEQESTKVNKEVGKHSSTVLSIPNPQNEKSLSKNRSGSISKRDDQTIELKASVQDQNEKVYPFVDDLP